MEGKRKGNLASWPQPRCIWGQTPQRFCWRWDLAQHTTQATGLHRLIRSEQGRSWGSLTKTLGLCQSLPTGKSGKSTLALGPRELLPDQSRNGAEQN